MDLSTFQLVDAINDMDMLRNLSGQQQPEQYSQQQSNNNNAYNQLHGDIDMLFQSDQLSGSPHVNSYLAYKNNCASTTTSVSTQSNQIMSSPHYRSTLNNNQRQNDCFDQEVYNRKSNNDESMY